MSSKIIYCFIFCHLCTIAIRGQLLEKAPVTTFLETRMGGGMMIPHASVTEALKGALYTFDMQWGIVTKGDQYWQQAYRRPSYGLGFHYSYMLNQHMGKSYGIYTFFNLPLTEYPEAKLSLSSAAGLVYHTKPLDLDYNPENYALTTPWLALLEFGLDLEVYLNKKWSLSFWSGLTHMSNGAYNKPNKGSNSFVARGGLRYYLNNEQQIYKEILKEPDYDTYSIDMHLASARFKVSPVRERFTGHLAQLVFHYRLNYKRRVGVGIDYIYDGSGVSRESYTGKKIDLRQVALVFSHEAMIDKFSILSQIGIYMYNGYDKQFYERIALRYWMSKHFYCSVGLKAWWFSAERLEVGIGYSLGWS